MRIEITGKIACNGKEDLLALIRDASASNTRDGGDKKRGGRESY